MIFFASKGRVGLRGGQYDGEKIPGDLNQWNVLSSDSNLILRSTYGDLSRRSMTLYHTYGPARAAINKQIEYAVGPGLVFRSQPDYNTLGISRESAKDWGKEFQKIVHYYMQEFNAYEMQSVLMRGALTHGDSLLFFLRDMDGLQDIVEFSGNQIAWERQEEDVTLGIWHDEFMRRLGFYKAEDQKLIRFRDSAGNQNAIQYFEKELPRQMRGYPLIYSIINLAKNDDRHTDATTHRAVMESIIIGSTQTDTTNPIKQTENMANANLKKYRRDENASLLNKIANSFKLGTGNMYQVKTGEKVEFTDLKTPSNTFKDFKEYILDYIGAATGTPSQMITSKYSTSYTSHKGTFNDFKKSYMKKRATFERNVMNTMIREIAKDAIMRGYISAPGFFDNPMMRSAYLQGMYLGPVPGSINPLQEVNANIKAVENAFDLRSNISSLYGNEWDNMLEEWKQEQAEWFEGSNDAQSARIAEQEAEGNAVTDSE